MKLKNLVRQLGKKWYAYWPWILFYRAVAERLDEHERILAHVEGREPGTGSKRIVLLTHRRVFIYDFAGGIRSSILPTRSLDPAAGSFGGN